MARRHLKLLSLALLVAVLLPPQGDAQSAPDPSPAACCNVADAPPPPVSSSDEAFFSTASSVPNVMILLDNSSSMLSLPRSTATFPIEFPEDLPEQGTCALPSTSPLERLSRARTSTPYDSGYRTYYRGGGLALDDTPAWSAACTNQSAPTSDRAWDSCLFRPTSYYKYVLVERDGSTSQAPVNVWISGAEAYNATPQLDADGAPTTNDGPCVAVAGAGGAKAGTAAELAVYYASCVRCLSDKGYFVFAPPSGPRQAVLRGDLLNVYPDNPLIPKAHTARKLLKDVIKLDPQSRGAADSVRFGLTVTTGSNRTCEGASAETLADRMRDYDGGRLLVPLGPDCTASSDMTVTAFVAARQAIIDAVNDTSGSAGECTGFVDFGSWTPPGEALFNIGQYFTEAGTSSLYRSLFGEGWMKLSGTDASQNFAESSPGAVDAPWAAAGRNQRSVCFTCQQSSVLFISDGEPTTDGNLPRDPTPGVHDVFDGDFRSWAIPSFTEDCPNCAEEVLHKVAAFLAGTDLRTTGAMSGTQAVRTYAVSFGLDPATNADPIRLLNKTAELGQTTRAFITNSDSELKAALDAVVSDVERRMTSFSATAVASLQSGRTGSADAYLGRFRPTRGPVWEGHLYAAQIFDEFGQGCSEAFTTANQRTFACGAHPTQNPNLDGDTLPSGLARCASSYLVDDDCDPIVEGDDGFWKGTFDDVTHGLAPSVPADRAALAWDAGAALSDPADPQVVANGSYRSADAAVGNERRRRIWTVVDVDANGRLDPGESVEFVPTNAEALAPMMALPAAAQPSTTALPSPAPWCNAWLDESGVCGRAPLPSCGDTAAAVRTACAKQIIHFYRGWDVTDQDGDKCGGPDNHFNDHPWGACTTDAHCRRNEQDGASCQDGQCLNRAGSCPGGEERDRSADSRVNPGERDMWKLGDIFHSSPVLVRPPLSKEYCRTGAFNQCVLTLYSALGGNAHATTPLERSGTVDAYDQWRQAHLARDQFVVVGANDGMLHAFQAGSARPGTGSPVQGYAYTAGTGAELWAFIPPDLLPRLQHGLGSHTAFVDGSPMVRDVWVDGSGADPRKDGTKQHDEFHTIVVITERSGGQRFTALDVTEPSSPRFLWTFPQPCSKESKLVGQTWSDFLPRPPPIGPVRLALPADGGGQDPLGRGFEERWIALLNGGYDPALVRGRGVFMVDIWDGSVVWSYTDEDFRRVRGHDRASMFPVAAGVAMVDIGAADDRTRTKADTDGYFDTATWGDLGGNLFTARFHEPGQLGDDGRVTNWTAARSFEQNRQSNDVQLAAGRGPFFFMTANTLDGPSRLVTLAGSGDRENLLLTENTCGPTNLLGCCASGCTEGTATTATRSGAGSCTQGGTFSCADGVMTFAQAESSPACGTPGFACGAVAAPEVNQQTDLSFACGAAGDVSGTSRFAFDAAGLVSVDEPVDPRRTTVGTAALGAPVPQYRMFGVWSYGEIGGRRFVDETSARAFDDYRFTDVAYSGCTGRPGDGSCQLVETAAALTHTTAAGLETDCRDGATKCWADSDDPGWMYSYGRRCPMETCAEATWTGERTATAASVALRCADWSTLRPDRGGGTPCAPSGGGDHAELTYLLDAVKGVPREACGVEDETPSLAYYAARQKSTRAPPQAGATRIVVNDEGRVGYSTLKLEAGSAPEKTSFGTRASGSEMLYWLEVNRAMHVCRHVDGTTCR